MLQRAARNRLISLAAVFVYLGAATALTADAMQRAAVHSIVVITLGYGHLIGAFWSSRRRARRAPSTAPAGRSFGFEAARSRRLVAAARFAVLASAFAIFTGSLASNLAVVLLLLAVSTWHVAENDLSLEDRYDDSGRPDAAIPRLDERVAALGLTAVLLAAASICLGPADGALELRGHGLELAFVAWWLRGAAILAGCGLVLRERSPRLEGIGLALIGAGVFLPASLAGPFGFGFADLFAVTTGYHLASWLIRSIERACALDDGSGRLLVAAHAVPIGLASLCLANSLPGASDLRALFFAPAPYLFWSVVHVVDTWIQRRR